MGGNPWHYFTPYRADLNAALQHLKEQEFRAGRYGFDYWLNQTRAELQEVGANFPDIPQEFIQVVDQSKPSADELIAEYGSLQAAMDAVLEESAPDGTQSILDITHVSDRPGMHAVCPLTTDELQEIFQTTQSTRETVEAILLNEEDYEAWEAFWESIGRGEGRYVIVYEKGKPTEIFFAGYSFD